MARPVLRQPRTMHIDTVCRETCFRQSSLLSMYGSAMDHMLGRAEFPYGACCGPMCVGGIYVAVLYLYAAILCVSPSSSNCMRD